MKKIILITLLTVLTATVGHAADDIVVDGVIYEWYAQNNQYGYIATGWDEETPIQSLHIRGEVDGYQVFGIKNDAFGDNTDIEYLRIDEGVTYIGSYAFSRCANLKVAILPEGLETIWQFAFEFDSSLTTMVIPSTVTEIQAHAFSYCTGVTDVYFLMDETKLANFEGWWDGIYRNEDNPGGTEFNGSRLEGHNPQNGTHFHVPQGMLGAYESSGQFDEWLIEEEDDNCYPLWWIVNYGVERSEYTVSDDLTAVYIDKYGGLYAKDNNNWLTPDKVYPGEIDYMKTTGLMSQHGNVYDQSNWVKLINVGNPVSFINHLIAGNSITGTLLDKKNPIIEVSNDAVLEIGGDAHYEPNIYIPASFMGRTQLGKNDKTYAFVQPKPQELIHVKWTIYNEDDNCFYLPEPDEDNDINSMGLKGGIEMSLALYDGEEDPDMVDYGIYAFDAINQRIDNSAVKSSLHKEELSYNPYTDGGVSDTFIVYPLKLPDDVTPTAISELERNSLKADNRWYSIDGRHLGTTTPSTPGIYIHNKKKVIIK